MRDYLLVFVNGQEYSVEGDDAFLTLAEYLRIRQGLTGTKVVCAEGDCGSCSVLVGRRGNDQFHYQVIDSCIQFMYQLDRCHVITVEGLERSGELHPVQQAIVDCHGSQCGYCTPGIVVATASLFESRPRAADGACAPLPAADIRVGLSGNLCRCTGYVQILEAALSIEPDSVDSLQDLYPAEEMLARCRSLGDLPVRIATIVSGREHVVTIPHELREAARCKAENPDALVVSGATDVGVWRNRGQSTAANIVSLSAIAGLDDVSIEQSSLISGARATWSQVEAFVEHKIPEFYKILRRFGSPQIRNVATVGGNLANASSIADSLPFYSVMDAEIDLVGPAHSRSVGINEFFTGHHETVMRSDELIARIRTPMPAPDDDLKLYKVSRRRDLDIATLTAGILVRRSGQRIVAARVAIGGAGPTVSRAHDAESYLVNKPFVADVFRAAGCRTRREIAPISDVRGSADYRWQLAENILVKFFHDVSRCDADAIARAE